MWETTVHTVRRKRLGRAVFSWEFLARSWAQPPELFPYTLILAHQRPALDSTSVWEGLGLTVGYCACLGYRGLKGRRSTIVAYTVVTLSIIVAIAVAHLAAEMYANREAACGVQLTLAAGHLLLLERLKSMAFGLCLGLIGAWSGRSYLLWYTDPARAVRTFGEKVLAAPPSGRSCPESSLCGTGGRGSAWAERSAHYCLQAFWRPRLLLLTRWRSGAGCCFAYASLHRAQLAESILC